jgi:hypothetical protein
MYSKLARSLNIYELSMRKYYKLNKSVQMLPTIYIGNKTLDNYAHDSTMIVTKNGNNFSTINNPYIYQSLDANYKQLLDQSTMLKRDLKIITISHRIWQFLSKKYKCSRL